VLGAAVGWRKSKFEKMLYFSKYTPSTWLQRQDDGISVWVKEQETIAWMADFYEERFLKLSSCLFQQVAIEANIAQVPSFGALEYDEVNKSVLPEHVRHDVPTFPTGVLSFPAVLRDATHHHPPPICMTGILPPCCCI
jgi:hypothetical protein